MDHAGQVFGEVERREFVGPADLPATTLRVTLNQAQPFVELELTIRNKAKDNWPEADWLCLPFKVASDRPSPIGEVLRRPR